MAADQAVALIVVGSLWACHKIIEHIKDDFAIVKNLGYSLVLLFVLAGLNLANQIAQNDAGVSAAVRRSVEVVYVGYFWAFLFIILMLVVLYFKDLVLFLIKVGNYLVNVFRGKT